MIFATTTLGDTMNKITMALISLLTSLIFAGSALADGHLASEHAEKHPEKAACMMASAPIIPDGNVASEDELVAASGAMKAYQGKLQEYRDCMVGMEEGLDAEAEDDAIKLAEIRAKYDASVDAEAAIAEEFNLAVRAFKARQ